MRTKVHEYVQKSWPRYKTSTESSHHCKSQLKCHLLRDALHDHPPKVHFYFVSVAASFSSHCSLYLTYFKTFLSFPSPFPLGWDSPKNQLHKDKESICKKGKNIQEEKLDKKNREKRSGAVGWVVSGGCLGLAFSRLDVPSCLLSLPSPGNTNLPAPHTRVPLWNHRGRGWALKRHHLGTGAVSVPRHRKHLGILWFLCPLWASWSQECWRAWAGARLLVFVGVSLGFPHSHWGDCQS